MVVLKEINDMVWGIVVTSGTEYFHEVQRPFRITMAALETNLEVGSPRKEDCVQVMLRMGPTKFLMCTLDHHLHPQQSLDLCFSCGEKLGIYLVGRGTVHFTGSLMRNEGDFADDFDEDEYDSEDAVPPLIAAVDSGDEDDDEMDDDWAPELEVGWKRKGSDLAHSSQKRLKITELDSDEDIESDDEEEYDSSFIDDEAVGEEEEEEEEQESAEEEEEEEGDDDATILSVKKKDKKKASSNETPDSKKKKKKKDKSPKSNENSQQSSQSQASSAGDAAKDGAAADKKKKKKKKNKDKQADDGDQQQQQGQAGQSPKTPQTPSKSTPPVGKKRTVAGGTCVEDSKIGHGPEAKPGKFVSVYYSGVLAKNNKRFDSCLKGKPFRFRLGRGEVIKGWDTGVIGMKVGGKRKITVPPSQGYGNARQGPIPAGSTLVFEVELKAIN